MREHRSPGSHRHKKCTLFYRIFFFLWISLVSYEKDCRQGGKWKNRVLGDADVEERSSCHCEKRLKIDQWMFGRVMCHIMPFLQCVTVLVSTLILISIAIVRYHMIKHPVSNHLTANHGYFLIATVWTLGFAMCSPLPVFHSLVELQETFGSALLSSRYLCVESWPSDAYRIAFTISLLLVQYILPLVCLTVSHTSVCRSISCGLSNQENQLEENEMIDLELIILPFFQELISYESAYWHKLSKSPYSASQPIKKSSPK